MFGAISARDACQFGADRATGFGGKLLEKLDAIGHPDLQGKTEEFRAVNTALDHSAAARDAAELAAASLDVQRIGLRQAVEKQAAATEIAVLTVYPGRGDLVSALLSPDRPAPAAHPAPAAADAAAPAAAIPAPGGTSAA